MYNTRRLELKMLLLEALQNREMSQALRKPSAFLFYTALQKQL